jgi:tRNA threonylcarbamoyl adenosine modification protein YeaZ
VLVLAIDTSTPTVTAGAVRVKRPHELLAEVHAAAAPGEGSPAAGDGASGRELPAPSTVLAEHTVTDPFGHAEHLMPLVQAALVQAGHTVSDLEAVVVGIGPGPFTGLRVGMATAAALGDALDVPVHGVPSHDAMARRAAVDGDFLIVTDARRREVYLSAYTESLARLHGPVVIAPVAVPDLLRAHGLRPGWVGGAGAGLVAGVLTLPVRNPSRPLSGCLVDCALQPLLTAAVPGPLTPLYLRRPDATEPAPPKRVLGSGEYVTAGIPVTAAESVGHDRSQQDGRRR